MQGSRAYGAAMLTPRSLIALVVVLALATTAFGSTPAAAVADSATRPMLTPSAAGVVTRFAGTGNTGFSGHGVPATNADIRIDDRFCVGTTSCLSVGGGSIRTDSSGRVYFMQTLATIPFEQSDRAFVIRRIDTDGTIRTVLGRFCSISVNPPYALNRPAPAIGLTADDVCPFLEQRDRPRIWTVDGDGRVYVMDVRACGAGEVTLLRVDLDGIIRLHATLTGLACNERFNQLLNDPMHWGGDGARVLLDGQGQVGFATERADAVFDRRGTRYLPVATPVCSVDPLSLDCQTLIVATDRSGAARVVAGGGTVDGGGAVATATRFRGSDVALGLHASGDLLVGRGGSLWRVPIEGGQGPFCSPSSAVRDLAVPEPSAPSAPGTSTFVPVIPNRLFDTRVGGSAGRLCAGQTYRVPVLGRAGLPSSGVAAVVLNLTATDDVGSGYLTVWPTGAARPNASSLNVRPLDTVANTVVAPVGADGSISIWKANDARTFDGAHLLGDVVGYIPSGVGFTPVTPARVLDTRTGNGAAAAPVAPGGQVDVQVAGRGGVPPTGAVAVVMNLTAADATAAGYLTAWPTGQARPDASNLNLAPGEPRSNLVIVGLGADGKVSLRNADDSPSNRSVSVLADVVGWFDASSGFTAVAPTRLLDTRSGNGVAAGVVVPGRQIDVVVRGRNGVPGNATAVVANVTASDTAGPGYATVWPSGVTRPGTSAVNWSAGQTVANAVIATIGADGRVSLWNANDAPAFGTTHLLLDVTGAFGP